MKSQKNINESFENHKPSQTALSTSEKDLIDALLSGQIVTIPTETVEGYAVKLGDEAGIRARIPELLRLYRTLAVSIPKSLRSLPTFRPATRSTVPSLQQRLPASSPCAMAVSALFSKPARKTSPSNPTA